MTTIVPRLPLYPKPLRKELKPQRGEPMTIAAGFRFMDGIMLCADMEQTGSITVSSESKIFIQANDDCCLVITGAGTTGYMRVFADDIGQRLRSSKRWEWEEVRGLIQERISWMRTQYVEPARQLGDENYGATMLIGYNNRHADGTALYKINEAGQPDIIQHNFDCFGYGEPICRYLLDCLYRMYDNESVDSMKDLAISTVYEASRMSRYCGWPIQFAVLKNDRTSPCGPLGTVRNPLPLSDIFHCFTPVLKAMLTSAMTRSEFDLRLSHAIAELRDLRLNWFTTMPYLPDK